MGKILTLILIAVIFSGCGISKRNALLPTPSATIAPLAKATLVLDFGIGAATTYEKIAAKTAFELLEKVAEENGITMDVKKYDFGMLVNSIDGRENTKDLAWIYYVNGKSADVGADSYQLKEGDVVEWKYIKPIF